MKRLLLTLSFITSQLSISHIVAQIVSTEPVRLETPKARIDEQQAWNALTVKVPEYAPWAIHGFTRMTEQYKKVQPYMDASDNRYTQEEIDQAASALNAIVNTMRPGNLPELEDLDELQQLLEKAKQVAHSETSDRAISYASMVIRYVSDGSGTMDMIERATRQLKEALKE